MTTPVYVLGAYAQNQFFLLGYQTPAKNIDIPTYYRLEDARQLFSAFDFLYRKQPKLPSEILHLRFLEQTQLLIYGVPEALADRLEYQIEFSNFAPKTLDWVTLENQPANMLPLKHSSRIASKYLAFNLYASILNANKSIPSELRRMDIGRETADANDYWKIDNLLKIKNEN